MTTEHQALAHQRRESDRRADRAGNAVTTPKVDGPTSGKIALQRLAGNRAVAAMQAGVVQRKGPGQGGTKPAKPQAIASPFNSYVDLLNGFQELAAAAINRGGAGLDTVRFGRDLSPSHRYLLARVRAVLIQAQEQDKDARVQAAAAWPALAAKLQVAVSEARRLQLPGEPLANVIDQIAMVSRKYVHSRRGKADPEVETPEDYADTVMGMQELLAVFSMMGESGQGLIREEVPNRKDAAVSLAILEVNARQRAALAAVKFGSHLNRRHAKVLDTLRKALILARTEAPGSAYRAEALWRSIQGEMQHVLRRAPNYVDGDIGPAIRAFGATGEVLARHYAAVHQDNLRVALTKERAKEQVKTDKTMGEAMGPSVAKAMKEARVLEDFQHALTVLEQHLAPSPAHAGEWVLTSGGTVIRVRGDQVESLRGTAGAALKRFMADITTVMVDAWQTYDSIKRGNSSFKLRVLGGWGGATDPGDQEDVKNSVMRVRDTIVYPLVDQGKYVEAFRMIISQKGVVERHAREVGDYDADLDRGYNRLSTAMKVIQVALVALVPVAGEAALASGAGVWAVGGTAVAAGGGGAAVAETGRQLASGEDLNPSKIREAAYSGGVIGVSAVAPVATRGMGKVLAAGGEGTTLAAANALASGTVGAVHSKLGGGDAIEGFAGGAVGSLAGSAMKGLGPVAQRPLIQGGVGAGTAALTGGDPIAGAVGGMVGARSSAQKPAKARGCFVPGTPVLTPRGPVPIEQVAVGDEVTAYDLGRSALITQRVVAAIARTVPSIMDIQVEGHLIRCSPEHPFWVPGEGWRPAGMLIAGTALLTAEGAAVTVTKLRRNADTGWRVHNLSVAGQETYFISDLAVLVHNKAQGSSFQTLQKVTEKDVRALVERADETLRRAQAQPPDVPNRQATIDQADALNKRLRDVEKDVRRSSTDEDLADLIDYQFELKKELKSLDEQLPAGTVVEPPSGRPPVTPVARPLTAEDAMAEFPRSVPWEWLNRNHPGRTWSGQLAETMKSTNTDEIKRKMIVSGEIEGSAPVHFEISVIYDHTTGTFVDFFFSSGKEPLPH